MPSARLLTLTTRPVPSAPIFLLTPICHARLTALGSPPSASAFTVELALAPAAFASGSVGAVDDLGVESVTGATPVAAVVVVLDATAAPAPAFEPPLVMLNCTDWARMAWLPVCAETRLIWNAVPTGHAPFGNETWAVFCTLGEPVDWLWVRVTSLPGRKPCCECQRRRGRRDAYASGITREGYVYGATHLVAELHLERVGIRANGLPGNHLGAGTALPDRVLVRVEHLDCGRAGEDGKGREGERAGSVHCDVGGGVGKERGLPGGRTRRGQLNEA